MITHYKSQLFCFKKCILCYYELNQLNQLLHPGLYLDHDMENLNITIIDKNIAEYKFFTKYKA